MAAQSQKWIDVSVPLTSGMAHWPGEPEPNFELISNMQTGAVANVTMCRMVAHTGTHMDAPRHFIADGVTVEAFPFEVAIGKARVIELPDLDAVTGKELEGKGIGAGDRVLIKTRNSKLHWTTMDFQENYVGLDSSAARFLVKAGVVLVGVDYLSVGLFHGDNPETHQTLLGAGVWIVEGLALDQVSAGVYDFICLPLRIDGCDGSPVRAILRPSGA